MWIFANMERDAEMINGGHVDKIEGTEISDEEYNLYRARIMNEARDQKKKREQVRKEQNGGQ